VREYKGNTAKILDGTLACINSVTRHKFPCQQIHCCLRQFGLFDEISDGAIAPSELCGIA
jgi:hypothetical protein